jgi:hypothetical protein
MDRFCLKHSPLVHSERTVQDSAIGLSVAWRMPNVGAIPWVVSLD